MVGAATECREILSDAVQMAIWSFYADYTPVKYVRHYYNFLKNSYIKYYKNPHNKIIYGGVELSPDNMKDIY